MTQSQHSLVFPTLTRSSSLSHRSQKLQNKGSKPAIPIIRSSSLSDRTSQSTHTVSRSKSVPQKTTKPILITPPVRSSSLQQDQDVAKSLIAWKYQSMIKEVDWNNLFSNSQRLWLGDENIFELEDTVKQNEVKRITELLWQEEGFIEKKGVASYLGKWNPFHHKVLVAYMNYFQFNSMTLEEAFRKLCSKLYFKAEAQEIDRILEAFAFRYWTQNSNSIYLNADIVYAITYSIMLLNTDLYVIQSNSHTKMSCSSFCDNLMSTLNEFNVEINQEETLERLKEIYLSVKNQGILQPQETTMKTFLKRIGSKRVKNAT